MADGVVVTRNQAGGDAGIDIIQATTPLLQPLRIFLADGKTLVFAVTPNGSVSLLGGLSANQKLVTATYAALTTDYLIEGDATAAGFTITLPLAAAAGGRSIPLIIVKADSGGNAVTVSRAGSDTIAGANTVVLAAQYAGVMLFSDGVATWYKTTMP